MHILWDILLWMLTKLAVFINYMEMKGLIITIFNLLCTELFKENMILNLYGLS